MSPHPQDTVIIIGAARSGTNVLRDVLCRLPGFATWPCDEINYIWRYGNASWPNDELTVSHARPNVKAFIRRAFRRLKQRTEARFLVEKTCANSLRPEFVNCILPYSRYVLLLRDGRDVVPSAMKRWRAPLDVGYVARKARFVPLRDVPIHATRYLRNRLFRLFSSENRLATWGPRFEGMEDLLDSRGLAVTCAVQWKRCVERSVTALSRLSPQRVHRLRYEDFVEDPVRELIRITGFLGLTIAREEAERASAVVSADRVGAGKNTLSSESELEVAPIVNPTLEALGYTVE